MRSLFWTFASAFFLVLVTSLMLQALVIVAVVHPLTERRARAAAVALARDVAGEIADLRSGDADPDAVRSILRRRERARAGGILLYRTADGAVIGGRPFPPGARDPLARVLDAGHGDAAFPVPGDEPGPLPPDPGGDARGVPPPGDRGRRPDLVVNASWPVEADSGPSGVVYVLGADRSFRLWSPTVPRPLMLFFPVAIGLSAAAAFVLFRMIVRRLRALESLAARVAEGELSARVDDRTADEIGRLAQGLNAMTVRLGEARDHLEESDRGRRRLTADIAHELATPMTSLKGYAETLVDPQVALSDAERESYLRTMLHETDRLDALVKDLFELTRLEADAVALEPERLDVTELMRNVVQRWAPRFRDVGLHLAWHGGDTPALSDADGRRLEQVVENLLRNALRYVPAGGHVGVRVFAGPVGGAHRFEVEDDGPGIAPGDHERVFERFFRADAARTDGGTGLGLAIAKEIVERHGGTIKVEDRPGGGARFVVELRAAA